MRSTETRHYLNGIFTYTNKKQNFFFASQDHLLEVNDDF